MPAAYSREMVAQGFPQLEIVETLASGGQGTTFLVDQGGDRSVLKVFFPHVEFARVEHEIAKLPLIRCENVVRLKGHGTVELNGRPSRYVLLDFVQGRTLSSLDVPLAEEAVRRLLCDVTNAIQAFWDAQLVHRDLTPSNIMLADSGAHVVIDLSFAKHVDRTSVTAQGMTVGTSGFMSPEQAAGRRHLTFHSDVFTLGVTVFQVATGGHPYGGFQPTFFSPRVSLSTLNVVSADLAGLVDRMLHPRAHLRPSLDELRAFCNGGA